MAGALLLRGPRRPHQAPFPQGCRHLWYRLLALLPAAQPWHYALKQISGRFGSSVLSYFLFLKTLLMFNVFSLLILLVFVVALQAAYPPAKANQQPFAGFELLTGAVSTSSASLPVPPWTPQHCGCEGGCPMLPRALCPCRLVQPHARLGAVGTPEVTVLVVHFPTGLLHPLAAVLWLLQQHHPQ